MVWCNYEWAWGGRYTHYYTTQSLNGCAILEHELQPICFQGQSLDIETGLHYNRFRYYDTDVGMFISRDPIGLLGGNNVFEYAPNPVGWVDPWGLDCVQNKKNGTEREKRAKEILEKCYGKDNVISEKTLRDVNGKKVIDPITLTGRRVDFIVKKSDGKWYVIEVTSKTADKDAQQDKEKRIRKKGGTYFKHPKTKEILYIENLSKIMRTK